MTVPDELVQAVHDATADQQAPWDRWDKRPRIAFYLDAVPDGYARIYGTWRKLTDDELLRLREDVQ